MKLLIEGWRGVNHSFALVNQHQILEMLRRPGLQLYHRDLPFALPHWNAKSHSAGFAPDDAQRIAALSLPDGPVDCTLRLCSPYRSGGEDGAPLVTFMVTEMGLSRDALDAEPAAFTRGGRHIVTPTRWSRERLLEGGFDAERVHLVRHGVDTRVLHPASAEERALSRRNLGLDDSFVFLNVGAALWNKGVDLVLLAFAQLRRAGRPVRLILKDHQGLYGVSVGQMIQQLMQANPGLIDEQVLQAVQVVPGNLDQDSMRLLYGVADCYVSPYRAEGFNLPVLEAIACGLPVVVTDGGATDDFVDAGVGLRVPSDPGQMPGDAAAGPRRFREPRLPPLVEAMDAISRGPRSADTALYQAARRACLDRMSWPNAVDELLQVVRGCVH